MKHIKLFESFDGKLQELKSICNDILVNMSDNDFTINVEDMKNDSLVIEIFKSDYGFFKWIEIKDCIIFLLLHIKDDYNILGQSIDMFCVGYGNKSYYVSDIISDDLKGDVDRQFMSVSIDINL